MGEPDLRSRQRGGATSSRRGRMLRRLGLAGLVAVAAVVGLVVLSGPDTGENDPLSELCEVARTEHAALSGLESERAEALHRLENAAPEELATLMEAASTGSAGLPDDLFVLPGDRNSDVNAEVAAEVWAQMAQSRQAWDRIEQVLVSDCELDLDGGAG